MTLLRLASHTRPSTTPNLGNNDENPWAKAACAGFADNTFYPRPPKTPAAEWETESAKLICNGQQVNGEPDIPGCPIRDLCRTHALTTGETHGVWGGLSEHERAGLYTTEVSA